MIYILLGVIIALQGWSLYQHWPDAPKVIPPTDDHVRDTLRKHFKGAGLNDDHFSADYDLIPSGKLGDILIHTSAQLGKPIRTVRDVHDLLVK